MDRRLGIGYAVLAALVLATFALSAIYSMRPLSFYLDIAGAQVMLICWMLPLPLWIATLVFRLARRGCQYPLRAVLMMVRNHRYWLLRGLLLTALALPLGRAFSAFKSSIPLHSDYWADRPLADFERLIFTDDAWVFTHAIIGDQGTIWIDRAYLVWFVVLMLTIAWLNFTQDRRFQLRGLIAYVSSWLVLGMLGAVTFASAGPCFFDFFHGGDRFAPLLARLDNVHETTPLTAVHEMRWLLAKYDTAEFGSGISAMPSMHVAVAWLIVLLCHYRFGLSWQTGLAAAYAMIILLGSVHLGWHYVSDGLVSIFVVSLIWRITAFITKPEGRVARAEMIESPA